MQNFDPSKFQDQLLRGLTHKMNNILSLFHGYLGMLLEDKALDANTLSGLEHIREGAVLASELMDRAQSLIRPTSLTLQEVDLNELLTNSKTGLECLCTRGIRIEISSADHLPPVAADAARLRSALLEIVSNAIEASPDNELVRIQAEGNFPACLNNEGPSPATAWVGLTIRNKGSEIPPDTLKRVFEPFFTTRQKRHAFGLGLPVALGNVRLFGGTVGFERIGDETLCRIMIPIQTGQPS